MILTRMILTQKVDHFTVFESFPSTSCCSQKFPPNNWLVGRARLYQGCLHWLGGGGWTGRKMLYIAQMVVGH